MYVENILNLAHAAQGAATNANRSKFGSRQTNNTANARTIQLSTHIYIYQRVIKIVCLSDCWENLTNDRSNLIAQKIAQTLGQPINQLTDLYTNYNLKY